MAESVSNDLFKEFPDKSQDDWHKLAIKELEKSTKDISILQRASDSIPIPPYNTKEKSNSASPVLINKKPYLIHDVIRYNNAKGQNEFLLRKLANGIESIDLHLSTAEELTEVLQSIIPEAVDINWKFNSNWSENVVNLRQFFQSNNLLSHELKGSIQYDPLANLITSGNWFTSQEQDLKQLLNFSDLFSIAKLKYRTYLVNGEIYHNAGAEITTEIACILAHASEYLSYLTANGVDSSSLTNKFQINLSVGKNYFAEIAKIRAVRILWKLLLNSYKTEDSSVYILAKTSEYELTALDSQLNLLRATTAAMSASIGGCNALYIQPFDAATSNDNAFSERIARNIHHLIKEEAYLELSSDPSSGSYLLDELTDSIASEAWNKFKNIEAGGGLLESLKKEEIQKMIESEFLNSQKAVKEGKEIILGVNKFPNDKEDKDAIKVEIAKKIKAEKSSENPIIKVLQSTRSSQDIELNN